MLPPPDFDVRIRHDNEEDDAAAGETWMQGENKGGWFWCERQRGCVKQASLVGSDV